MLERIEIEPFGFDCPSFADELVRGETFEGLEPTAEIIGVDEIGEMSAQLVVIVIVVSLNGRVLDRAVHSLDLTVGPRMIDLGEAMRDSVLSASHAEHMCCIGRSRTVRVSRRQTKLNAVVGENRMDFIRDNFNERDEESRRLDAIGLFDKLREGELRGAVYGHEKIEFSFRRLHLGCRCERSRWDRT